MCCTDFPTAARRMALLAALGVLVAGCAQRPVAPSVPASPGAPAATVPAAPAPAARSASQGKVRNWDEYRLRAARQLVAANPERSHTGEVEQPALAIPVIEVELRADGSIQKINVMRQPSQAKDTTQLAIDAIHRAAPFGDVSNLPKPWRFSEVFLFNNDRRFKPRTLDQ